MTSSEKSAPPKGTPYAAAMPAPAPQATSRRRCSSDKRARSAKKLASTAPTCLGAPSRPSDAPMPTMMTESTALPSVRNAGMRPAKNQIAAVVSIPLPLDKRRRTICPTPVNTPAPRSTSRCRPALACSAAFRRLVPEPFQSTRWTNSSKAVNAAAPKPVLTPISRTASQNGAARGRVRLDGIASLLAMDIIDSTHALYTNPRSSAFRG